jgi:CMP-N-acetylneuraminic acid synthetase
MKTVAMLPIKLENERMPGKNTKPFFDGTPLMRLIQRSLLAVGGIDEIYCYCSNERVKGYLIGGVEFLQRPKELDLPTSNFSEFFGAFMLAVPADVYIAAFATAPFLKAEHILECLDKVKSGEFDTAFTAAKLQDFIWTESGKPLNFNPEKLPRTQDLPPLYRETGGLYVISKSAYEKTHRRIGENPYICLVSGIEATDIDDPEDFELANIIYKEIILRNGSTIT